MLFLTRRKIGFSTCLRTHYQLQKTLNAASFYSRSLNSLEVQKINCFSTIAIVKCTEKCASQLTSMILKHRQKVWNLNLKDYLEKIFPLNWILNFYFSPTDKDGTALSKTWFRASSTNFWGCLPVLIFWTSHLHCLYWAISLPVVHRQSAISLQISKSVRRIPLSLNSEVLFEYFSREIKWSGRKNDTV